MRTEDAVRFVRSVGAWGIAAGLSAAFVFTAGCGDRAGAVGGAAGAPADTSLGRLAADLLPVMETLGALPVRAPLALARKSKADLEAYLIDELGRQLPPERVASLVRAYARFGLVPDTIDLEPLLRSLYLEQVVGYYDPRSDTLFVVDGVEPAQVEAVLAHEIVHALQDQYVDLDSLMQATQDHNDRGTAARAALEGHATFAMLEWQLKQVTGAEVDLTAMPDLADLFADDPLAAAGLDMPVLAEAPAVIRESLLFPYLGGLGFVQESWRGPAGRVAPLGSEMPVSTEQVLHPERFRPDRRDMPVAVRFPGDLPDGWVEVHADGLGELETRIFLRQFLPDRVRADEAAAGWDGDRYRLLEGPGGEALVWATIWDSESDAAEFADAVGEAFARRYQVGGEAGRRAVRVEKSVVRGLHTAVITDEPSPPAGAVPLEVLVFELEEE
jgi:hypothetical protein